MREVSPEPKPKPYPISFEKLELIVAIALIVGYAVIFAVTVTVVRLVTVVWLTRGTGNLLTEPDSPAASVLEVLFHPHDFVPVKMPPVEGGKGLWMVDLFVLWAVKVRYKVE